MIKKAADMRTEPRENMRGGSGTATIVHCVEKDDLKANARLCAKLILPPGSGIGEHQHMAEDEVFIVIKGTGLLHDGVTETRVNAGDSVLTGNGASHAIRNDGDECLEIIAVIMCY